MLYLLLKWLHVSGAIALVGTHATYGFWIVRGSSHPAALPFILRNVIWLDRHLASPAYPVLIVTGLTMALEFGISLTTPWLLSALALLLILMAAHRQFYIPTVRRMLELFETQGLESPGFQAMAHREARLGIALVLVMVVIVFLMVVKPPLWR